MRRVFGLLSLLLIHSLQAAVVETLDGKRYEGEVYLEIDGTVAVASSRDVTRKIPFNRVAHAQFTTALTSLGGFGSLAPGWTNSDIGNVSIAGSAGQSNQTVAVRVGGGEAADRLDSLHFVYFPADGNSEIVVRVLSIEGADRRTKAGLMFRDTLKPDSRFALAAMDGEGQFSIHLRSSSNAPPGAGARVKTRLPGWLKLSRRENQFEAFESPDGKEWRSVGGFSAPLRESAYAGLFVAGHSPFAIATVLMDNVSRTIHGVQTEYFADTDFLKLRTNRIDSAVRFVVSGGADAEQNFSVSAARWTGLIEPRYSEHYIFHSDAPDAQLWVNGEAVEHVPFSHHGKRPASILLKASERYPFRFEYRGGPRSVRLGWSSQSQGKEPLPAKRLFCTIPAIAEAGAESSHPRQTQRSKGILLRNGTFISGTPRAATEQTVKFTYRAEKEYSVPTHQVAQIVFGVSPRNRMLTDTPLKPGALLANGDFVEGKVLLGSGKTAKVSSVLFGLRNYNLEKGDMAAVILGESLPRPGGYELRLADGSSFVADSIQVRGEEVEIREPLLGPVRVPRDIVAELRRVTARAGEERP